MGVRKVDFFSLTFSICLGLHFSIKGFTSRMPNVLLHIQQSDQGLFTKKFIFSGGGTDPLPPWSYKITFRLTHPPPLIMKNHFSPFSPFHLPQPLSPLPNLSPYHIYPTSTLITPTKPQPLSPLPNLSPHHP